MEEKDISTQTSIMLLTWIACHRIEIKMFSPKVEVWKSNFPKLGHFSSLKQKINWKMACKILRTINSGDEFNYNQHWQTNILSVWYILLFVITLRTHFNFM